METLLTLFLVWLIGFITFLIISFAFVFAKIDEFEGDESDILHGAFWASFFWVIIIPAFIIAIIIK